MKKIIFVTLIFLLSGCTVNYELIVDTDLSVEEKFSVSNNEEYYDMLGNVNDVYKQVIDYGMKETNYTSYNYLNKNNLYGVEVNYKYNSLVDFKEKASSYKKIYDDIEINRDGDIVTINSMGTFKLSPSVSENDESKDQLLIDKFYFSVKIPFKVISNNADRIDKQKNIYYWDITNNVKSDKNFKIEFDTSKKFISLTTIISKLDYTFVVIIVILLIVLITYANIKKKNERNNKI